jgi:hypothetical protein
MGPNDSTLAHTVASGSPALAASELNLEDSWFKAAAGAAPASDPAPERPHAIGSARLPVAAAERARGAPHQRRPAHTAGQSAREHRPAPSRGFRRIAGASALALAVIGVLAVVTSPPRPRVGAHARSSGGAVRAATLPAAIALTPPRANAAGQLLAPITASTAKRAPQARSQRSVHHASHPPNPVVPIPTGASPATPTPAATQRVEPPAPADSPRAAQRPVYRAPPPSRVGRPSFTPGDLTPATSTR